jgi:hypothetical protein
VSLLEQRMVDPTLLTARDKRKLRREFRRKGYRAVTSKSAAIFEASASSPAVAYGCVRQKDLQIVASAGRSL